MKIFFLVLGGLSSLFSFSFFMTFVTYGGKNKNFIQGPYVQDPHESRHLFQPCRKKYLYKGKNLSKSIYENKKETIALMMESLIEREEAREREEGLLPFKKNFHSQDPLFIDPKEMSNGPKISEEEKQEEKRERPKERLKEALAERLEERLKEELERRPKERLEESLEESLKERLEEKGGLEKWKETEINIHAKSLREGKKNSILPSSYHLMNLKNIGSSPQKSSFFLSLSQSLEQKNLPKQKVPKNRPEPQDFLQKNLPQNQKDSFLENHPKKEALSALVFLHPLHFSSQKFCFPSSRCRDYEEVQGENRGNLKPMEEPISPMSVFTFQDKKERYRQKRKTAVFFSEGLQEFSFAQDPSSYFKESFQKVTETFPLPPIPDEFLPSDSFSPSLKIEEKKHRKKERRETKEKKETRWQKEEEKEEKERDLWGLKKKEKHIFPLRLSSDKVSTTLKTPTPKSKSPEEEQFSKESQFPKGEKSFKEGHWEEKNSEGYYDSLRAKYSTKIMSYEEHRDYQRYSQRCLQQYYEDHQREFYPLSAESLQHKVPPSKRKKSKKFLEDDEKNLLDVSFFQQCSEYKRKKSKGKKPFSLRLFQWEHHKKFSRDPSPYKEFDYLSCLNPSFNNSSCSVEIIQESV